MPLRLFSSRKQKIRELHSLTDEQLIARFCRTADADCLGVLYERYTHLVFSVSMKYLQRDTDAEDMVMLVFEKLFEELKRSDVRNFKNWLYTLTKNQCLMLLRHHKTVEKSKDAIFHELELEIMESGDVLHLSSGENGGDADLLEKAILNLNEAQRQCVEWFYLHEKSYKEVAEITGYSMNEVKSHVQNGKRNLKIFLTKARET